MPNTNCPAWLDIAIPFVKEREGCRLTAYQDSVGVWTIGYGATGPGIRKGVVWTEQQAHADLVARLVVLGAQIDAYVVPELNDNQKAALVSLAYNIGSTAFRNSTLLRKLNAGDIQGAAAEFPRWNKAGGKAIAGLTNRRFAEQKMFLS